MICEFLRFKVPTVDNVHCALMEVANIAFPEPTSSKIFAKTSQSWRTGRAPRERPETQSRHER
jgi:hypothetical protein